MRTGLVDAAAEETQVTEDDPYEEIIEFPEDPVDERADENGDTSSVQGCVGPT